MIAVDRMRPPELMTPIPPTTAPTTPREPAEPAVTTHPPKSAKPAEIWEPWEPITPTTPTLSPSPSPRREQSRVSPSSMRMIDLSLERAARIHRGEKVVCRLRERRGGPYRRLLSHRELLRQQLQLLPPLHSKATPAPVTSPSVRLHSQLTQEACQSQLNPKNQGVPPSTGVAGSPNVTSPGIQD